MTGRTNRRNTRNGPLGDKEKEKTGNCLLQLIKGLSNDEKHELVMDLIQLSREAFAQRMVELDENNQIGSGGCRLSASSETLHWCAASYVTAKTSGKLAQSGESSQPEPSNSHRVAIQAGKSALPEKSPPGEGSKGPGSESTAASERHEGKGESSQSRGADLHKVTAQPSGGQPKAGELAINPQSQIPALDRRSKRKWQPTSIAGAKTQEQRGRSPHSQPHIRIPHSYGASQGPNPERRGRSSQSEPSDLPRVAIEPDGKQAKAKEPAVDPQSQRPPPAEQSKGPRQPDSGADLGEPEQIGQGSQSRSLRGSKRPAQRNSGAVSETHDGRGESSHVEPSNLRGVTTQPDEEQSKAGAPALDTQPQTSHPGARRKRSRHSDSTDSRRTYIAEKRPRYEESLAEFRRLLRGKMSRPDLLRLFKEALGALERKDFKNSFSGIKTILELMSDVKAEAWPTLRRITTSVHVDQLADTLPPSLAITQENWKQQWESLLTNTAEANTPAGASQDAGASQSDRLLCEIGNMQEVLHQLVSDILPVTVHGELAEQFHGVWPRGQIDNIYSRLGAADLVNCRRALQALRDERYAEFLLRLGPFLLCVDHNVVSEGSDLRWLTSHLPVNKVDDLVIHFQNEDEAAQEKCNKQWGAIIRAVCDFQRKAVVRSPGNGSESSDELLRVAPLPDSSSTISQLCQFAKHRKQQGMGGLVRILLYNYPHQLGVKHMERLLEALDEMIPTDKDLVSMCKFRQQLSALHADGVVDIPTADELISLCTLRQRVRALHKNDQGNIPTNDDLVSLCTLRQRVRALHKNDQENIPTIDDLVPLCEVRQRIKSLHKGDEAELPAAELVTLYELRHDLRQRSVAISQNEEFKVPDEKELLALYALLSELRKNLVGVYQDDRYNQQRFGDQRSQTNDLFDEKTSFLPTQDEELFQEIFNYVNQTHCQLEDNHHQMKLKHEALEVERQNLQQSQRATTESGSDKLMLDPDDEQETLTYREQIDLLHGFQQGFECEEVRTRLIKKMTRDLPQSDAKNVQERIERLRKGSTTTGQRTHTTLTTKFHDLLKDFEELVDFAERLDKQESRECKDVTHNATILRIHNVLLSREEQLQKCLTDLDEKIKGPKPMETSQASEDAGNSSQWQPCVDLVEGLSRWVDDILAQGTSGLSLREKVESWSKDSKELQDQKVLFEGLIEILPKESATGEPQNPREAQSALETVKIRVEDLVQKLQILQRGAKESDGNAFEELPPRLLEQRRAMDQIADGQDRPDLVHGSTNLAASLPHQGRPGSGENTLVPSEGNNQSTISPVNYQDTNEAQEMTKVVLQCHGRISLAKAKQDPKTALLDICRTMNEILDSMGADGEIHQLASDLKELSLLRAQKVLIGRHFENMREALSLPDGALLGPQGLVVQVEEKAMQHIAQIKLWYGCVYGATKTQDGDFQTSQAEMESICRDTKQDGYDATFQDLLRDTRDLCFFLKAIGEDFCDVPLVKNGYTLSASVYAKSVYEAYVERKASDKAKEQMDTIKREVIDDPTPHFEEKTDDLGSSFKERLVEMEELLDSVTKEKKEVAESLLEIARGLPTVPMADDNPVRTALVAIRAALDEDIQLRGLLDKVTCLAPNTINIRKSEESAHSTPADQHDLSSTSQNGNGLPQWRRSVEGVCKIYRFIASIAPEERTVEEPNELLEKWRKDSVDLQQYKDCTEAHLRSVRDLLPDLPWKNAEDTGTKLKQVEDNLLKAFKTQREVISDLLEKVPQLSAVPNVPKAAPGFSNSRPGETTRLLESLVPAIVKAFESARRAEALDRGLQDIRDHPIMCSFRLGNLDNDDEIKDFYGNLYKYLTDRESGSKAQMDRTMSGLLDRIVQVSAHIPWFKSEACDDASETDHTLDRWTDTVTRVCAILQAFPNDNSTGTPGELLQRWYSDSCKLNEMIESMNVSFQRLMDSAGISHSEEAWDVHPSSEQMKRIVDRLLKKQDKDKHTIQSLRGELESKNACVHRAQEGTALETSSLEEYRGFFNMITEGFDGDIQYITKGLLQTTKGYAVAICRAHLDNKEKIQKVAGHVSALFSSHPSLLVHSHQSQDVGLVESVKGICDGMERVLRLVGPIDINEAIVCLDQHKQQALKFKDHVTQIGHILALQDDGLSVEGFAKRIEEEIQRLDQDYRDMTREPRIREVIILQNPPVSGIRAFHHGLREYLEKQEKRGQEHSELVKRIRDLGAITQKPRPAPLGTDQSPEVRSEDHSASEMIGLPQGITTRLESISKALVERLELRGLLEKLAREGAPGNPSGPHGLSRTSNSDTGLPQWQRSVEDVCEIYEFIRSIPKDESPDKNPKELLEKWYNDSKRAQTDLQCSRKENSDSKRKLVQRADQMKLWYDSVYGFATEEERGSLTRKADLVSIGSDTMEEGYTAPFRDLVHDTKQLHSFLMKVGSDFGNVNLIVRSGGKLSTSAYAESVYRAYSKARDKSNEIRQEVARMVESHPSVTRSSSHVIPDWDLSTTVRNICYIAKGHLDSINATSSSNTMTGRLSPDLTGRWESSTADATIESHLRSITGILQLEYNATIDDIKREIRSLAERSEKDRRDVMQKDAQVSSYETDIRELQGKLARLESALRTKEQENIELSSYKSDILELRRKLERLDAALALEARETAKLSTHDFNNTQLQRKLEQLEAELSSKEQEDVQLSNRIRTLWAMTQAPHVRPLPSGRWTKLKHDWMLRAFWAKGNMDHAVSNNDALEAMSAALVEWVKCRDLLELVVDAATRMKWEPKLLSSASEDEHRLVQWQESVTLVVKICECVRVAFQDQGSNGGPEGILKALPVDSRELQAYRRAIPAHLRQESNFKPEKLLKRWSADSAELQQYRRRTAEHLQLVMGLLSECPDSLSTGQHIVQHATFESVEQAVKSTLHSRQRTQAELEAAVSKLSHESKSAPGAEQSSRPVDRSASTIRQPRVEDNFTQIQQTLEAIKSTLDGTSAAGRPDSNSEVLIEFGASLNAALKSQKLDPAAIEEIIRPCLTSHDMDATVGVMVASLQARLESSVKDSLSAFIRAQAKPRITEVASPARPQNQEGVCPYCRKHVYSEFAWDQEKIYAHEEIIFEESHRPMIGVVTSLTKKSLYILALTGNEEAVPYERLLHECDADTAAHNARVLYEKCRQIVATGRNRLRQVPDELAFEDCDVKIWVLKGIIFEVRLRNGETREVPGNCLKNWGAHALDRMRDAVRAYKRKAIPPSPDPAYLAQRVKDVLNP